MAVEVEDRGLGLTRVELDELNTRLAECRSSTWRRVTRLGLFVVARLAARNGIKVALDASPYGGLTAIVSLPADLLADQPVPA